MSDQELREALEQYEEADAEFGMRRCYYGVLNGDTASAEEALIQAGKNLYQVAKRLVPEETAQN
jgi:hypothetical protein